MPAEGFFQRWSRLKTEPAPAETVAGDKLHDPQRPLAPAPVPAAQPGQAAQQAHEESAPVRQPTLDDVAQLRADSDYSAFVARGVDKSVQRSALKKLFADPHFNTGDGLDLYMGDYNKPDPIPAAMMSALRHTQSFFAQAYPDRKTGDEDKDRDDADSGTLAMENESDSMITLSNPERQMADTAGTTGSAIATGASSGAASTSTIGGSTTGTSATIIGTSTIGPSTIGASTSTGTSATGTNGASSTTSTIIEDKA